MISEDHFAIPSPPAKYKTTTPKTVTVSPRRSPRKNMGTRVPDSTPQGPKHHSTPQLARKTTHNSSTSKKKVTSRVTLFPDQHSRSESESENITENLYGEMSSDDEDDILTAPPRTDPVNKPEKGKQAEKDRTPMPWLSKISLILVKCNVD